MELGPMVVAFLCSLIVILFISLGATARGIILLRREEERPLSSEDYQVLIMPESLTGEDVARDTPDDLEVIRAHLAFPDDLIEEGEWKSPAWGGITAVADVIDDKPFVKPPKKSKRGSTLGEVLVAIVFPAFVIYSAVMLISSINSDAASPTNYQLKAVGRLNTCDTLYVVELDGNEYYATSVHGGYVLCPKLPPRVEKTP